MLTTVGARLSGLNASLHKGWRAHARTLWHAGRHELINLDRGAADVRGSSRHVSIGIEQYAIVSDGQRVVFDRPGFSIGVAGVDNSWAHLTAEDIEDDVRTTLQPETESAFEPDLDLPRVARRLSRLGVETSAAQLVDVPHHIELSERLRARLAS